MTVGGGKSWFSAAELAELALPGLPRTKRKINEKAVDERWALRLDAEHRPLARPRAGRGGGTEYHVSLLPPGARIELVKRGLSSDASVVAEPPEVSSRNWAWFEQQSEKAKAEAHRRAAIVAEVDAMHAGGLTRSAAVAIAASRHEVSLSTLWGWLALVEGIDADDRLPALAPRRTGGGAQADCDDEAWRFFLSDYLRPEQPTISSCYYRMVREFAEPRGLKVPGERTFRRRVDALDQRMVTAKREGAEALRRMLPPQKRTVAELHAMELVNIDGHKFDVFVRFPDGKVQRPIMVAIQDVYSRKFLAWRIAQSEDAVATRLAFADLFQRWGIPKGCLLDNGRAFASKWITGGAKTRFRFKIRDEEPTGVLTALGIAIHWATPYRGQSKPIERGFRDLCDAIAKHPAFAGAYTGNKPDAKPENYGERAIDLDAFRRTVDAGMRAHNEKPGRRTEAGRGMFSFDQAFAASYAQAPIGKATDEQLRMALLTGEEISTDRRTGAINIHGNRYWSQELSQFAGQKLTIRFDPDDLLLPLHVYDRAGRFLCTAPVWEATGFLDVASAKERARLEADHRKATRRAIEAEQLLTAAQIAALIPDHPDETAPIAPTVVRPVRHRGQTAAALKPLSAPAQTDAAPSFAEKFATAATRLRLVE